MPQKLAHTPNEPNTLITVSIESEEPHSGEIPRVHLGGTNWHANDLNGPGNQTDGSHGQVDKPRGLADALNVSYNAEMAMLGHGDNLSTHLGAGDTKRVMCETDSLGSHADTSDGHLDIPSIEKNVLIPIIAPDTVSTHPTEVKPPDIPYSTAKWTLNESDGLSSHADRLSARTGSQSVETDMEMARDEAETISICPVESKLPKSPTKGANGCANETDGSRSTPGMLNMRTHSITPADKAGNIRTRQIESKWPNPPISAAKQLPDKLNSCGNRADRSIGHTDVHSIGNNAGTAENMLKNVRMRQNGWKTPNSPPDGARWAPDMPNGFRNHADTSGTRTDGHSVTNGVKTATNATKIIRGSPIEPEPPNSPAGSATSHSVEPNGCGNPMDMSHGRTDAYTTGNDMDDTESGSNIDSQQVEENSPELSGPSTNPAEPPYRPTRHKCRCGMLRIKCLDDIKVSQTRNGETTYRGGARAAQPPVQPANDPYGPTGWQRRRETLKIERLNDKKSTKARERETTYQQHARAAQPRGNASKCQYGVHRPSRRHGRIKFEPINVNPAWNGKTPHPGHHQPMHPSPPAQIQLQHLVYGTSRSPMRKRQCGTPEIGRINISQAQNGKTTYLWHAHVAQPLDNASKCCFRDVRCQWRCGRIKITSTEVSQARNIETAYLARAHTAQPHGSPLKRSYRVFGPRHRRGQLKIAPTNVSQKHKEQNAYQGLYKPKLLLPLDPSDPARSMSIKSLQYGLQSLKKNLQNVSRKDNKSIRSYMHLSANGSIGILKVKESVTKNSKQKENQDKV